MNFFKRAIRYSFRQKLRSLLLLLTFTLLSTSVLICISSGKAVQQGTKQIKETVGASIRIDIDSQNQANYGSAEDFGNGQIGYTYNGDYITQDIVDKISKLDGVIGTNVTERDAFYAISDELNFFPGQFNMDIGIAPTFDTVLDSSLDIKFLNGTYKLVDGRHIKPDDKYVTLISKELADRNKLLVGDKIKFFEDYEHKKSYDFTIIGIYTGTEGTTKEGMFPFDIPANKGYIDTQSKNEIYEMKGYDSLDAYTKSPQEAEKLLNTIKNLPELNGKTFVFGVNSEDFEMVSTPLSSFGSMVDTAVKVIMVIGTLVITLLLVLWTRSRQKEIGILLAIGKSKAEIFGQFLIENLLIALLSMGATAGLTYSLADQIGKFIISKSNEDVSNLIVSVSTSDMMYVFGIGIVLICIAVIIAFYTVIRLKPKDILSKMS
ncbi:FtsX-like permease family protein [Clostridiales bacterium CHKCI001]|nr:FtsX-like permease family protein [Clostridiales bacterium CHKCI001]